MTPAEMLQIIDRGFPSGSPLDRSLISRAMRFSCELHAKQTRKGGKPYFLHCIGVGVRLAWAGEDSETIAAGFCHDLVEDQGVKYQKLANLFGARMATIVMEVTKITMGSGERRAMRVAMDHAHYAAASPEGQSLKLCDGLDNTENILRDDPGFAPLYLSEWRDLVPRLTRGNPLLYEAAVAQILKSAIPVLHHDDGCTERLEPNGYCATCRIRPDTQSTAIYFYCPTCNVKLDNDSHCATCQGRFRRP